MNINAFLIIMAAIPMITNCAAEPQSPPWQELPEIPVKKTGKYLKSDKDFLNFALFSHHIFKSLGKPFSKRKATSLLRYWKQQPRPFFTREHAAVLEPVRAVAFSSDSGLLAYGTYVGIKILEIENNSTVFDKFLAETVRYGQLTFSKPDPSHLELTYCEGNHINRMAVKKIANSEKYARPIVDQFNIPGFVGIKIVVLSSDGKQKAVGGPGTHVRMWDAHGQSQERYIAAINPDGLEITALCFSHDCNQIAIGDNEGKVTLWDLATNKTRILPSCGQDGWARIRISSVDFSPDDNQLVASLEVQHRRQGGIIVWNLKTNSFYNKDDTGAVACAVFSPDGKAIAYTCPDQGIVLINAESGDFINTIRCASPVLVKFSPTGKRIATGLWNGTLTLWRAGGCTELPQALDALIQHEDNSDNEKIS